MNRALLIVALVLVVLGFALLIIPTFPKEFAIWPFAGALLALIVGAFMGNPP